MPYINFFSTEASFLLVSTLPCLVLAAQCATLKPKRFVWWASMSATKCIRVVG